MSYLIEQRMKFKNGLRKLPEDRYEIPRFQDKGRLTADYQSDEYEKKVEKSRKNPRDMEISV